MKWGGGEVRYLRQIINARGKVIRRNNFRAGPGLGRNNTEVAQERNAAVFTGRYSSQTGRLEARKLLRQHKE